MDALWKKIREENKYKFWVLLFVGVCLLVCTMPGKQGRRKMYSDESEYQTHLEKRLENVLQKIEGVGRVSVMLTFQEGEDRRTSFLSDSIQQVEGVVVVAEGGDNAIAVKNITETIQALFGVEIHKIRVMKWTHVK